MSGGDGGKEGGKEGGEQEGVARKGGRGKAMTFPELMYCMYVVLGTNERFNSDRSQLSVCQPRTQPTRSVSSG